MADPGPAPLFPSARVVALQAEVDALRLRERLRAGAPQVDEAAWLRGVVARQAAEIEALREQLRKAQEERRSAAVETLVRSFAHALSAGEEAVPERTVTWARADLKVRLDVGDGAGVVAGDPHDLTGDSLSTISFELRRLAPTLEQEGLLAAAAD